MHSARGGWMLALDLPPFDGSASCASAWGQRVQFCPLRLHTVIVAAPTADGPSLRREHSAGLPMIRKRAA